MNCRIKTQKNGITVHTYAGLNNFICKVYKGHVSDKTKMNGHIVDTWLEAVDKHAEFCKEYLLPEPEEKTK